jgi:hypothetical protein
MNSTATPVPATAYSRRHDDLSFIVRKKPRGSGFDYWSVQSTGSYAQDCKLGRELGKEFLTYIGQHPTNGNSTLLGCIVLSMIDNASDDKRARGAELGFIREVSNYAMFMALLLKNPAKAKAMIEEAGE